MKVLVIPEDSRKDQFILQVLIEQAAADSEERSILEALSNHAAARGDVRAARQRQFLLGE